MRDYYDHLDNDPEMRQWLAHLDDPAFVPAVLPDEDEDETQDDDGDIGEPVGGEPCNEQQ